MAAFFILSLVWTMLVSCIVGVSAGQRNITAEPGDNVTLPCTEAKNEDIRVAEWSRTDLDQYVIFYRYQVTKGQFLSEGQSPSFKNRVDLLDVENGDVSLVLKNVTTDDTGRYECRVLYRGNDRRKIKDTDPISIINLRVEARNEEKLMEDGGNEDGPKEEGGCWSGLLVGLVIFFGLLFLVSVAVNFLLYRNRGRLCQGQKPSPAAGVELELMNPENRPPAEE